MKDTINFSIWYMLSDMKQKAMSIWFPWARSNIWPSTSRCSVSWTLEKLWGQETTSWCLVLLNFTPLSARMVPYCLKIICMFVWPLHMHCAGRSNEEQDWQSLWPDHFMYITHLLKDVLCGQVIHSHSLGIQMLNIYYPFDRYHVLVPYWQFPWQPWPAHSASYVPSFLSFSVFLVISLFSSPSFSVFWTFRASTIHIDCCTCLMIGSVFTCTKQENGNHKFQCILSERMFSRPFCLQHVNVTIMNEYESTKVRSLSTMWQCCILV